MAQRRMFSKQIVSTDAFLDMPSTAQLLYFHFNMEADDDGFVSSPKKIMKILGSADDDFKILVAKRFILIFESGVVVIKHWLIHNYIRKDTYTETKYEQEMKSLSLKDNGSYTERGRLVDGTETQVRVGKVRVGKVRVEDATAKTSEELKLQFFKNPLMEKIQLIYPDRDYNFQFDLMVDWWKTKKKKLPQNLSAFSNWLKFTKPDEILQAERRRKVDKELQDKKQQDMQNIPQNLDKLNELKSKLNLKSF